MALTSDNRTTFHLAINDLRDMFTAYAHPETIRSLIEPDNPIGIWEPHNELPTNRYGRSVNFNCREVYGAVGGLPREKIKHKYKGILTMSLEVFLESIGITTSGAEIGGIEFRRDNDTVEIYIRSKEQIIPIGDEHQLQLQTVPEGCEVPRINIENLE
jgi:hypothetical protein